MSVEDKIYWALSNGIVMAKCFDPISITDNVVVPQLRHAPIALNPFRFPRESFDKAIRLAPMFNELVHRISLDSEWLASQLQATAVSDDFTGRLLQIQTKIIRKQVSSWPQNITLGINRSDYMQHLADGDNRDLLQVEINTIASSFGALSQKITEMHQAFTTNSHEKSQIPENKAISGISKGIAVAHQLFINQNNLQDGTVISIMIVQGNEKNFSDQRLIEFYLLEHYGIIMHRETLENILMFGSIDEVTGVLSVRGVKVAVVYFRAGYT
jgi:glutathione synthase